MSALPLHAADHHNDPPPLELIHEPITKTLSDWAQRAGITDGTTGEVTVEIIFDTSNGHVRRAIVHRKLGADGLDTLGQHEPRT